MLPLLCLQQSCIASFVAVGFKRQGISVVADIALQVAIIGMLIGSVGLLQNMSDPKAAGFAALTLSVVFYGLLIAGICSQLSNISEPIAAPLAWQRVVSVLLWTGIVLYTMENAAGLAAFLDLVFPSIVALTLAIIGTSASEKLKSLVDARSLPVAGFAAGVLVGVIGMLQNMSNPKAIGLAMAIALLTLTYCNLISVTLKLAFPETILRER